MKLTDKTIKGIKPKNSAYRIYENGADKGFGIKVTPAGGISFFVQYASHGKQRFYNLGRYPSVSLSDARERCRDARLMIDKGIDPQDRPSQAFGTVSDLFGYYIDTMKSDGKRTWAKVESDINYNCKELMTMPANTVEPIHIKNVLTPIIMRGSKVQANRIRSYMKRAFDLGIHHDHNPESTSDFLFNIKSNPVDAIPKNTKAEKVGERNLSFDEIKTLWFDESINEQFHLIIKLLLIYGCRPMELCMALKSEFDDNVWSIPPERVKNKRWHLLPITPLARTLFEELMIYSRNSIYLVPSRYDDNKPIYETSLGHAIRRITSIDYFVPRDLRRTVKTRMGEIGIEKSIRDRIQNHALNDVSSKHYDRYDYLTEKRKGLEEWENYLIYFLNI